MRNRQGCFLGNFKPLHGNYVDDGGLHTVPVDSLPSVRYGGEKKWCIAHNFPDSLATCKAEFPLALVSDTIYGRELLCEPVTFSVNRTLRINAMQVDMADSATP